MTVTRHEMALAKLRICTSRPQLCSSSIGTKTQGTGEKLHDGRRPPHEVRSLHRKLPRRSVPSTISPGEGTCVTRLTCTPCSVLSLCWPNGCLRRSRSSPASARTRRAWEKEGPEEAGQRRLPLRDDLAVATETEGNDRVKRRLADVGNGRFDGRVSRRQIAAHVRATTSPCSTIASPTSAAPGGKARLSVAISPSAAIRTSRCRAGRIESDGRR